MRRRQRGRAEEGVRVEGEAGRGCRAAGVAGAWSPRGDRVLTRSGRGAGERRGAARRQARRAWGWAGPRRGGLARARGFAGPASAVGRETRRRPVKGEKPFSSYIFKKFSNTSFQISF